MRYFPTIWRGGYFGEISLFYFAFEMFIIIAIDKSDEAIIW